jgi:hypothetical protein
MIADEPVRRPARSGTGNRVSVTIKIASVFFLYLALSYVSLAPGAGWRTKVIGGAGDAMQFVWFLAWWPYAITHHLNPFVTKLIWAQLGFNMTWATAVPFAALFAAPVTYSLCSPHRWRPLRPFSSLALLRAIGSARSSAAFYSAFHPMNWASDWAICMRISMR